MSKDNAYHVTISGSYRTTGSDYIDFADVKGYIPMVGDEEFAVAMIRKRYATMWITLDKKYKNRVTSMREVFIDYMTPAEHEFSYVGKDIKDLTYEELQDVATAKDLRAVPLYKKGGLRQSQIVCYATYSDKVLGVEVDYKTKVLNLVQAKVIKVSAGCENNAVETFTNDEIIQQEMDSISTDGATFTRAELEKLAQGKSIAFNPNISDANLRKRIFSA